MDSRACRREVLYTLFAVFVAGAIFPTVAEKEIPLHPPVMVIPAPRRGLSNMRMRLIQDIAGAHMLGFREVQLPDHVWTAVGKLDAAVKYDRKIPLWQLYDLNATAEALGKLGIRAFAGKSSHNPIPVLSEQIPLLASELLGEMPHEYLADGKRWMLQPWNKCCVNLIADTADSLHLFGKVNEAIKSRNKTREVAAQIIGALRAKIGSANNNGQVIALHWRDETDVTGSKNNVSRAAYFSEIHSHLVAICHSMRTNVLTLLVLGAQTSEEVDALEHEFNQWTIKKITKDANKHAGTCRIAIESKLTLADISGSELTRILGNTQECQAQLDFELGILSDIFVGSSFSSFSAMIAHLRHSRSAQEPIATHSKVEEFTVMPSGPAMDTTGHYPLVFGAAFPWSVSLEGRVRRCEAFQMVHPMWAGTLKPWCSIDSLNLTYPQHSTLLTAET